jgi:hypothetical protein
VNRKHNEDRNKRVYAYYLKHPEMTMEAIAGVFHLKSRQRISMIIKEQKLLALPVEKSK